MILALSITAFLAYLTLAIVLHLRKNNQPGSPLAPKIAFFHPFCNDGGGGQKVLWSIIQALLQKLPSTATVQQYKNQPIINIYSLQSNSHQILTKVSNRFNIKLSDYSHRINFIHVTGKTLLTPKSKLTMLLHILLPMVYTIKCLFKYQPDIFYDTTGNPILNSGFAFNFFIVKLLLPSCQCRAYVHYPFISQDMVNKIKQRKTDFNNDANISQSKWKTQVKLIYYQAILNLYKLVRFTVTSAQANSTWTYDHMVKLWGKGIQKLYPPCSISELLEYPKTFPTSPIKIISLAQFRPQKNHNLQIHVIENLIKKLSLSNPNNQPDLVLYICGTTRHSQDELLLQSLVNKVKLLKLENHIKFCVNMKFSDLLQKMKQCNYGIHCMQAQHFGISIVQMISAGILVVAHNSAGPKYDIIKNQHFLAQTQQEYEQKLFNLIQMNPKQKQSLVQQFRSKMNQFGQISFKNNFRNIFQQQNQQHLKNV